MIRFAWGQVVRDKVTGFIGAVVGRTEYATGCVHYGLLPCKLTSKGAVPEWTWFDGSRLEETKRKKKDIGVRPATGNTWSVTSSFLSPPDPGGPSPSAPEN